MNLTGITIHKNQWDKVIRIRDEIERLESRADKALDKFDYVNTVLRPFAKSLIPAIEKRYGKKVVKRVNQHQTDLKFYGPFGLRCERSVIWCFTDGTEAWLHIAEGDHSFTVDTGKVGANGYPNNSIGEVNGFGNESIAIENLTEKQVISFISLHDQAK